MRPVTLGLGHKTFTVDVCHACVPAFGAEACPMCRQRALHVLGYPVNLGERL